MNRRNGLGLVFVLLAACASDIKGEKGDPGPPGEDAGSAVAVSLRRPDYYTRPGHANQTELIVPATAERPARVAIGGVVYTNTANETLSLAVSAGRGGVDTGAWEKNKLYYLYAIPDEAGTGFDLIASLSSPNYGPAGHDARSYLGAFHTDGVTPQLLPLTSVGGDLHMNLGNPAFDVTVASTAEEPNLAEHLLAVPIGARVVHLRAWLTNPGADSLLTLSSNRYGDIIVVSSVEGLVFEFVSWPINNPQKLYGRVNQDGLTGHLRILGWTENPAEFP